MWFEAIIREETGCAPYMIGCQSTANAPCSIPSGISPYLGMAKKQGSTIRYIIDSHTHADHVSRARLLAEGERRVGRGRGLPHDRRPGEGV